LRLTVDLNNVLEIIKVIFIDGQNLGPLSTEEKCGKVKKKRFLEKKNYSEKIPRICGRSNQRDRECLQNKTK